MTKEALVKEALRRLAAGEKIVGIRFAREFGVRNTTAYEAIKEAKALLGGVVDGEPEKTLSEFGVSGYAVERLIVNKWGDEKNPNRQVKVVLRPAGGGFDMPPPPPIPERRAVDGEAVALVGISDLHIGLLAWSAETGEPPWDSRIAEAVLADYMAWANEILRREKPQVIILPVGGDILHADGKEGATAGGTPLDVDTRWQKSFTVALGAMKRAVRGVIEVGSAIGASVYVPVVSGNHDTERAFYLGKALEAWAEGAGLPVKVMTSPHPRQYLLVGGVLFGFTHGHRPKPQKLPLLMAIEAKGLWGSATTAEWVIGHYHARGELFASSIGGSVRIRVLPSLAPADAWHTQEGFVGRPQEAPVIIYRDGAPSAEYLWRPHAWKKYRPGRG